MARHAGGSAPGLDMLPFTSPCAPIAIYEFQSNDGEKAVNEISGFKNISSAGLGGS
jgi:hypothetical protein